jgi:light-regulated signal transduction histidine kinase (bacteriophytochrome)
MDWAAKPRLVIHEDGHGSLEPRHSFKRWTVSQQRILSIPYSTHTGNSISGVGLTREIFSHLRVVSSGDITLTIRRRP